MEELKIEKFNYNENFLKIVVSSIDKILAYWNITRDYDNSFKQKYGEDFFEKTKAFLVLKCLSTGSEEKIELKEYTNNYYIKYKYSNAIYTVELVREGINDNKDYGYKFISNKIQTPFIKVGLNSYNYEDVKFKNVKNGNNVNADNLCKEEIEDLYSNKIIPGWNEYKKENGYRE